MTHLCTEMVVANHCDGGESSVVVTTLWTILFLCSRMILTLEVSSLVSSYVFFTYNC